MRWPLAKGPTLRGRDVFTIKVPLSGIEYAPELHWRLAAAWANYTWEQFQKLDGEDQAAHIAAYESKMQIEAVLAREQIMRMKRSMPRGSGN